MWTLPAFTLLTTKPFLAATEVSHTPSTNAGERLDGALASWGRWAPMFVQSLSPRGQGQIQPGAGQGVKPTMPLEPLPGR
jgi:hypothetical protein